jgi:predicted ATPase
VATLSGFGVSGYRSLFGDVQWIPVGPSVTVFLGGNNSGKSNVLRLLDLI